MRKNGKFMANQPNINRACAYCHSGQHQGYMTVKMVKANGCNAKHCPYLEIYRDHPYWVDREKKKADKKARKEAETMHISA